MKLDRAVLVPFVLSLCFWPVSGAPTARAAARAAVQPAVRALPKVVTDAYTGSVPFFTIVPVEFRAQYWYAGRNLPQPYTVRDLGIRVAPNVAVGAQSRTVAIRAANTTVGFGSLTASFAGNLGASPQTVFTRKLVNFPAAPPANDPNVAAAWFPGDQPFVFTGPHLVVDFSVGTSNSPASISNDSFVIMPPSNAVHASGRPGCGGTLAASYDGVTATWTLTGAPPASPVGFNLGLENVVFAGQALPFDLGPIGMAGCHLGMVPLAEAAVMADAGGTAQLALPFSPPSPTLALVAQAVHQRVANPQGLQDFATSNTVNSAFGGLGLANSLFAGAANATTSQLGPFPFDNAVVLLVR